MRTGRAIVIATIFIFLVVSVSSPRLVAASSGANYTIDVDGGATRFSLSIQARQNFTALRSGFAFPTFHSVASGVNSTSIASQVQDALRTRSGQADVSNLVIDARAGTWSNVTSLQWFNVTLFFDVNGISSTKSDAAQVDLAWKSFSVTQNVQLGGFEVNNIGTKYASSLASDLSKLKSSQLASYTFQLNGRDVTPVRFGNPTLLPNLLNYTRLETPLANWKFNYTSLATTNTYSLTDPNLGMALIRTIQEQQIPTTEAFGIFYDVTGQVTVPNNSRVQGDLVSTYRGTPEALMGAMIIALGAVVSGAYVYEKRLTSSLGKGYTSKKKQRRQS